MTTVATKVREWTDAPEPGRTEDDWPYPTEHIQFLITGDLATRVQKRLGEPDSAAVFLTEDRISGGYSEFTQETEFEFTIECGGRTVRFDQWDIRFNYGGTTVAQLESWLNQVEST